MSTHDERFSLLLELIKLAKKDEFHSEDELNFILAVANQLGIDRETFDSIIDLNAPFHPPVMEAERIIQFHRLVLLMNIDHHISPEELEFIRNAGIRLGLHPEATNKVLAEMDLYPNGVVPVQRLIEIFQVHHN